MFYIYIVWSSELLQFILKYYMKLSKYNIFYLLNTEYTKNWFIENKVQIKVIYITDFTSDRI